MATEDCRNTPITPLCTCATRAAISLLLFFLFFCWNRIPRVQITELLGLPHCKAASGDQALPLSSSIQRSGVETIRALQQASSICYKNKRRKHSNDNDVFFFFFFCCNPENSQSASENRAGTLQEEGMRGRSRVHVQAAARVTEAALRWCFFSSRLGLGFGERLKNRWKKKKKCFGSMRGDGAWTRRRRRTRS